MEYILGRRGGVAEELVQSPLDNRDCRILVAHGSGMVNLKNFSVSNLMWIFMYGWVNGE